MKRNDNKRRPSKRRDSLARAGFRSVVVPIDLTPSSDRVLRRLSLLPLARDARVTLAHVVPGHLAPGERRSAVREAGSALADEERYLRKSLSATVRIDTRVEVGTAAREIGACANRARAQLIVMGRGGRRALREAFLGSTAERVIRKARLPVLVVGPPPRAAYGRPLVALELDRAAYEVIRFMLLLVPPPRPPVAVIHAFGVPYRTVISGSLSEEDLAELDDKFRQEATGELARVVAAALSRAGVRPADAPSRLHARFGSPRAVVGKAVRKMDADLLVLGTRGYSGAAYAFVGSVAGDLLRNARCDVLVVPPATSRP